MRRFFEPHTAAGTNEQNGRAITYTLSGWEAQLEIEKLDDDLCDLLMVLRRTNVTEKRRAGMESQLDRAIEGLRNWRKRNGYDRA